MSNFRVLAPLGVALTQLVAGCGKQGQEERMTPLETNARPAVALDWSKYTNPPPRERTSNLHAAQRQSVTESIAYDSGPLAGDGRITIESSLSNKDELSGLELPIPPEPKVIKQIKWPDSPPPVVGSSTNKIQYTVLTYRSKNSKQGVQSVDEKHRCLEAMLARLDPFASQQKLEYKKWDASKLNWGDAFTVEIDRRNLEWVEQFCRNPGNFDNDVFILDQATLGRVIQGFDPKNP